MIEPKDVDPVFMAFPANVVGTYLPLWDEIPEEFKQHDHTKWNQKFNTLFFVGAQIKLEPKKGIDPAKAWAHIRACMGSFEPKHEHKEAGVSYLMSLWFDDIILTPIEK